MTPEEDYRSACLRRLAEILEEQNRLLNPDLRPFVDRVSEFVYVDKTTEPDTRVMFRTTKPDGTQSIGEFAGILIKKNVVHLVGTVLEDGFDAVVEAKSPVLETSNHLFGISPDGTRWSLRHEVVTEALRDNLVASTKKKNDYLN